MIYSHEVEQMCTVAQGVNHGAAPIPEEAKWVQSKEIKDISGLTHGIGWYHSGGSCGNHRMFRYDSLRSYGSRDPSGQNNS